MYEGSLCLCCMSTDNLLELFTTHTINNTFENYAKILSACFSIQVSQKDGHNYMCKACVSRLREAVSFKRQILTTMCILTSSSIESIVLDPEDIKVLGLREADPEEYEFAEDYKAEETLDDEDDKDFKPEIKIEHKEEDSSQDNTESLTIDSSKKRKHKLYMKRIGSNKKKSRGRPRKHPKYEMPYVIRPDDLKCLECNEEFASHQVLRWHYNTHFRNFQCDQCDKAFITSVGLKRHRTTHLKGPFPCPLCDRVFTNMNSLHSHRRYKHSSVPLYQCRVCGHRFHTFSQRLSHLASAHGMDQRNYKCPHCEKSFRYSGERSKHISNSHDKTLHSCPLCSYRSKKQYIKAHLANQHQVGEKRHQCPYCLKRFSRGVTLTQHVRIHLDDRRFKCAICDRTFVQKCSLKSHIKTHVKRGEFKGDENLLLNMNDETLNADDVALDPNSDEDLGEEVLDNDFLTDELLNGDYLMEEHLDSVGEEQNEDHLDIADQRVLEALDELCGNDDSQEGMTPDELEEEEVQILEVEYDGALEDDIDNKELRTIEGSV